MRIIVGTAFLYVLSYAHVDMVTNKDLLLGCLLLMFYWEFEKDDSGSCKNWKNFVFKKKSSSRPN